MPQINTVEIQNDYGKFVLEPLERGYGQTIGNALRRVLLSSVQGAAIAAIRVDGILHEFAPIEGVKEDTTELLLNLKNVAINATPASVGSEATLTIDVKGPGTVTGADIVCPEGISIANPEVYIATISEDVTLSVELFVAWGAGYVLPQNQDRYRGDIGMLPTGSQFTPVTKVNYTVESTRVGMRTDYERLVIDVHTNGALAPNDAISQSANILLGYFKMFQDIGESLTPIDTEAPAPGGIDVSHLPEVRVEEMEFSQRTFNCLRRAGILNLRQLASTSEADLTGIRGFGKKSLLEVRDKLSEHGIEMDLSKGGRGAIEEFDEEEEEL